MPSALCRRMINLMLVVVALQTAPAVERSELLEELPGRAALTTKLAAGSLLATGSLVAGAFAMIGVLSGAPTNCFILCFDLRMIGGIGLLLSAAVGVTGIWLLYSGSTALEERHRIEVRLAQLGADPDAPPERQVLPEHGDRLPPAPATLGWAWSL